MRLCSPTLLLPLAMVLGCTPAQPTRPTGSAPAITPLPASAPATQPLKPPAADNRYPFMKAGFVESTGRSWPLQRFEPQQPGPLLSVTTPHNRHRLCATAKSAVALDAGPRQNWAAKKATQLLGGMLGGLLGGTDTDPPTPATVSNPLQHLPQQTFAHGPAITLSMNGQLTPEGVLINTHIVEASGKPTFHYVYLEQRDCQRAWPSRYLVYKLWLEWSLSVSWTRTQTQYRNGEQVSQRTRRGGFNRSGETTLASGQINRATPDALGQHTQAILAHAPVPIWQRLGFNGPSAGVRAVGSQFQGIHANNLPGDTAVVVHITHPAGARYTTIAKAFRIQPDARGMLRFTPL